MPLFRKKQGNANANKWKGKNWLSAKAWRDWGREKWKKSKAGKKADERKTKKMHEMPKGTEGVVDLIFGGPKASMHAVEEVEAEAKRRIEERERKEKEEKSAKQKPRIERPIIVEKRVSFQEAIESRRRQIEEIELKTAERQLREDERLVLERLDKDLQNAIASLELKGSEKGRDFIPTLQALSRKARMLLKK